MLCGKGMQPWRFHDPFRESHDPIPYGARGMGSFYITAGSHVWSTCEQGFKFTSILSGHVWTKEPEANTRGSGPYVLELNSKTGSMPKAASIHGDSAEWKTSPLKQGNILQTCEPFLQMEQLVLKDSGALISVRRLSEYVTLRLLWEQDVGCRIWLTLDTIKRIMQGCQNSS